ncbi:hypothetical protein B1757_12600 [Acidithiobacillus marinus]|uniref:Uncharacterized protein n=1 Tax=Acidithiobacillus marinus TaxID=187490 RepID=A0A2I1DJ46_9PROT|nr:hypothetical protein B1757_12600 [Acidithiobacillus marinus]
MRQHILAIATTAYWYLKSIPLTPINFAWEYDSFDFFLCNYTMIILQFREDFMTFICQVIKL